MRLTFEAVNIQDLIFQMKATLGHIDKASTVELRSATSPSIPAPTQAQGPGPDIAAVEKKLNEPWPKPPKPVEKPVEQRRVRTERQLANDERLRAAALAKIEAKKAAKIAKADMGAGIVQPIRPTPPEPVEEPEVFADPAEVVRIREKTIRDLQEAYANGHQQEVFELLSRFGNGAKSFRELPPDAFVPISEAIAKGALT